MSKQAALCVLLSSGLALLASRSAIGAARDIDQHQAVDPNGTVEIVNVAGSVIVTGWDRPDVWVTGHLGGQVERVEVSASANHAVVRVILPSGSHWGGDGSARLTIRVPARSSLEGSSVSADWTVSGVTGAEQIRTASGDIKSDGSAATRINTLNGDVRASVIPGSAAEIESMSGDVMLTGAGGDVSVTTVSGDGHLKLEALHSFRLHTVSGDFTIDARLEPGAQFEGSSVSGDVHVNFAAMPGAQYELQSLSGDISNCAAPKPERAQFGPGSRLSFTSGDGKSQVHMSSSSGDLSVCPK